MGMIFIYTYSSYPSYSFHTILTNKPYSPAPLLPAFSYIHCQPIYLLLVFSRRFTNRSRIPFSLAPSVSGPVVLFHIMLSLRRLSLLSVSRLVGASRRSGPCRRSVPRLVISARRNGAPFLSVRFLVSSCPLSFVPFVVSWGRCVLAVRSARRPACRLVVRFGFLASRRSSRAASRAASRFLIRLCSSCSSCRSLFLVHVVAHRMRASPLRLVVGIGWSVSLKR